MDLQRASLLNDEDEARFGAAMDLFRADRYEEAERVFEDLARRDPGSKACRTLHGWCVKEQGRTAEAMGIFQATVTAFPKSEKASLGLFYTLWDLGFQVEALEEMKRYIRMNPGSVEYQRLRRELVAEIEEKCK